MSQLALVRSLLQLKEKEKKRKTIFKTKRKEKEILNNDLAVLPSHDILVSTSSFFPNLPGWNLINRLNCERNSDHLARC